MHAVALETLQAERAEASWREAHARHPQLPEALVELPERIERDGVHRGDGRELHQSLGLHVADL
jgi:hypothetical protein